MRTVSGKLTSIHALLLAFLVGGFVALAMEFGNPARHPDVLSLVRRCAWHRPVEHETGPRSNQSGVFVPMNHADEGEATPACVRLRIMIPLYSYPNWYDPKHYIWDDVAAANGEVPITAIINPNNGPDGCHPNEDYLHGLTDLRNGGVKIIGYVYTSYGRRPLSDVKHDIEMYGSGCYDLDGVFLDEASSDASDIGYYASLYDYARSTVHLDQVVLNPGTFMDEGYVSNPACDTAVTFESYAREWPGYAPPSYMVKYPRERFAMMAHTVPDLEAMKSGVDLALVRRMGYVYFTDDSGSNPYDSLPSFWSQEVEYVRQVNRCVLWLPLP